MSINCLFCTRDVTNDAEGKIRPSSTVYICKCCGFVNLEEEARDDFEAHYPNKKDRISISITLRNEWEIRKHKLSKTKLTLFDLEKIIKNYKPLSPLDKMDNALLHFGNLSSYVGSEIRIDHTVDHFLYHCAEPNELVSICKFLFQEGYIDIPDPSNPQVLPTITAKGYLRLSELENPNKDSKQCFVAMWFHNEMKQVYEEAIKPAIEFIENGATTPKFRAIKIDNVEHVNDINDEIIAQIRRSRFMVCDLTGYRGGVYFEAGFAYGLGLDVIYTCRKDWTKEEGLKDNNDNVIDYLYDKNKKKIKIKKEGVHFDLSHRNRIDWTEDNLSEFKNKLENRIKAIIY